MSNSVKAIARLAVSKMTAQERAEHVERVCSDLDRLIGRPGCDPRAAHRLRHKIAVYYGLNVDELIDVGPPVPSKPRGRRKWLGQ